MDFAEAAAIVLTSKGHAGKVYELAGDQYYTLKDLAAEFHSYYNAERMLVDDAALKEARIALAGAVRQVIRNGLAILGVSCPQSM